MLQAIARLALAAPRRIIAIALFVMLSSAIFGIPAIGRPDRLPQTSQPEIPATDFAAMKAGLSDQLRAQVPTRDRS